MSVTVATINGTEPVSLSEAKDHCYVTGSAHDTLFTSLITVAREYAEGFTWRAIIDATYEMRLDGFPNGEIELPKPPVRAIDSIKYVNTEGTLVTLDSAEYETDTDGEYGRVKPVSSWPATKDQYNAVRIMFTAGYDGSAAAYTVPKQIKQGMLMLIKHLFDNRESVVMSEGNTLNIKEVPMSTKHLLGMQSAREFV